MQIKPDFKVFNTCILAKNNPTTAVKIISKTVFIAPIFWPILIITKISTTGRAIIANSIVFICLIQKYIINVYLANNE